MDDDIPILRRRQIEAEVIKPIYEAFKAEIGEEKTREILARAIIEAAHSTGRAFRDKESGPVDLTTFAALLPLWQKDDALQIEYLERSADRLDFNVTRCRYAEAYAAMGLRDIGGLLSCNRDGEFCRGYDPRIRFSRTQTIMEGAEFCDFRYALEDPEEPNRQP